VVISVAEASPFSLARAQHARTDRENNGTRFHRNLKKYRPSQLLSSGSATRDRSETGAWPVLAMGFDQKSACQWLMGSRWTRRQPMGGLRPSWMAAESLGRWYEFRNSRRSKRPPDRAPLELCLI